MEEHIAIIEVSPFVIIKALKTRGVGAYPKVGIFQSRAVYIKVKQVFDVGRAV